MTLQVILGGVFPTFINETSKRQAILPGIFLDETTVYTATRSETGSAADTSSCALALPCTISEIGSASDTSSEHFIANPVCAETGSATDTSSCTVTYQCTVSETGSATDHVSELFIANRTVSETGLAADLESCLLTLHCSISEAGTAADQENATVTRIPPVNIVTGKLGTLIMVRFY